jgi:hypothetical protein
LSITSCILDLPVEEMGTFTYPCVKNLSRLLREPAKFGHANPFLPSIHKQNHIRHATCVLDAVNNNKALRIERHQEQQILGRVRLKAAALASGKEAESPLKTEPSSWEHQKQEELDAVGLVQELQENEECGMEGGAVEGAGSDDEGARGRDF